MSSTSAPSTVSQGDDAAPRPVAKPERPARRRWWERALGPLATVVLTLLGMAQALRVWEWRPGTPLGLTSDAPAMTVLVRGYMWFGPYSDDPTFGAPFGLNLGWAPTGDDLHAWAFAFLGLFTSDPFTVMALYFFLGFPLAGLTMYWLCRTYSAGRVASTVVGVLFALLPGHQERFPHLFLSHYWVVPLAAHVLIQTALGHSVLKDGWGSVRSSRLFAVLLLLVIGLNDVYYVAFTLLLTATVILVRQIRRPNLREAVALSVPAAIVAFPALVSVSVARARTATDTVTGVAAFGRSFVDSDTYSGRFVDLLLPWAGHRVGSLSSMTQTYNVLTENVGEVAALGFVACVGLVGLAVVALARVLHREHQGKDLVIPVAVLVLIALAWFTRGGLGSLFALMVTPQIRTWSRLAVFVAAFTLMVVAWWLSRLARSKGRLFAGVLAALLLVIGVLDQTNPGRAPDYEALLARLTSLRSFTGQIETSLGTDCTIFNLPVLPYPEGSLVGREQFLTLGLASDHLHWSFGGMKGTSRADWQLGLSTTDAGRLVDDLATMGYCGVVIHDTFSQKSPTLASALPSILGTPVAASAGGEFTAYDLRPQRAALIERVGTSGLESRRAMVLSPVIASLGGVWPLESGPEVRYAVGPGTSITLSNLGSRPVEVRIGVRLHGPRAGVFAARLDGPSESSDVARVGPGGDKVLVLQVKALPGVSTVRLTDASGSAVDFDRLYDKEGLPYLAEVTMTSTDAVNIGVSLPPVASELGLR